MRKFVTVLLLTLTLLASAILAGTTGKIAGRVVDKSTGQPLIGVNVFLDGTVFGSTTDLDGNYIMLNIPPGKYILVLQYLGYQELRIPDLRVSIDATTRRDYEMSESALELDQAIVVEGTRALIQKDMTSSQSTVSAEDIQALPVVELSDVLQLQAGVTRDAGGGFHIRGGRTTEIAYWVNGISITDAFDNSQGIDIDNSSIQELQVISGTFNAEYGNAMSGIINTVTKEGASDLSGDVQLYTGDHLSNFTDYFYNIDHFNPFTDYNARASLSGPVPFTGKRVTFFVNGRYNSDDGYLYGQKRYNPDGSWASGDTLLQVAEQDDAEARYVTGSDGKLYKVVAPMSGDAAAMNWSKRYTGQGKLTYWPIPTIKLNAELLYSTNTYRDYDHSYKWAPSGDVKKYNNSYNTWLSMTHTVNSKTFYNVSLAYFERDFKEYLYKDPLDSRYVNADTLQPIAYAFRTIGTNQHHFNRQTNTTSAKMDFTSQVTNNHLLKVGFEGKWHKLTFDDFSTYWQRSGDVYQLQVPSDTTLSRTRYTRDPVEFAAYLQDKVEFDDLIINIGLRLDYFDSRGQILVNPKDPNIYNPIHPTEKEYLKSLSLEERKAYYYKNAKAKWQLSPRLGIAYPISAGGVIHFSYGHFLQIPTFNYLFNGGGYKVPDTGQFYGPYGNPDLEAQKTVMYELGLQQEFMNDFKLDLTGFYRDVRDWITAGPSIVTYSQVTYSKYINKDYANVKGITLALKKRYSNYYSFDVSYTFQMAEGSNSTPEEEFYSQQSNDEPTIFLLPLDWDQRHLFNGSVYVGAASWGSSLIARLGSGLPYTPSITQYTADRGIESGFLQNSRRRPYQFTMDLKLHKNLNLFNYQFTTFLRIFNLLDSRVAVNVFGDTGKPDFTTDQTPEDPVNRPNTVAEYRRYPWHYGEPRSVQLGLEWSF